MKRTFQDLRGYSVHARDGALGHVRDLVFSGNSWSVAFLAVDTRRWLAPRQALVRPHDVAAVDLKERRIDLTLSRSQVEERPSLAVSPAAEAFAHTHPMWSHYWITGGAIDPGISAHPFGPLIDDLSPEARARGELTPPQWEEGGYDVPRDVTAMGLVGCRVDSADGERCGQISDVVVEGLSWSAPYVIVDCGPWYAGRKALLPTALVRSVDPRQRVVATLVTADRWSEAPELVQDELEMLHESEVVEQFITPQSAMPPQPGAAGREALNGPHEGHELRV